MEKNKPRFQFTEARLGRQVLLGPFREEPDGRIALEEGATASSRGRRMYRASDHEEALRRQDRELDRRWTEIEADLTRRHPDAILRGKSVYYDFTFAPDLLASWTKLLNDAVASGGPEAKGPPPISFAHFLQVSERAAAALALRDPDGVREARLEGAGTLSVLGDHPDLDEQFQKDLRSPPRPASEPTSFTVGPNDPPPLDRHRELPMQELPWNNPLPMWGVSAATLTGYWAWLLSVRTQRLRQLEEAARKPDSSPGSSYRQWRKDRWTQIRLMESILDLIHQIVAPTAPYLCGEGCTHLGGGLDPGQAKRLLDSLDAYRATKDYESEENATAEQARRELARRLNA